MNNELDLSYKEKFTYGVMSFNGGNIVEGWDWAGNGEW